ncbi:MAG TPA: hydroxymethylbilane synthase, partial [Sphingomicrobium sp.]|nr:hydroxymethylbilane synthase [Sphingomicrobium sp.]
VAAERAFARALGGSCHSPVAAQARVEGNAVRLAGEILSEDGADRVRDEASFIAGDEEQAARLALAMLARASEAIRKLFAPA